VRAYYFPLYLLLLTGSFSLAMACKPENTKDVLLERGRIQEDARAAASLLGEVSEKITCVYDDWSKTVCQVIVNGVDLVKMVCETGCEITSITRIEHCPACIPCGSKFPRAEKE
jgi:hypothetical protein